MNDAELAGAWEQIRERLQREDIATFRTTLDRCDHDWPDEDWSAFLDVVVRCGCRLLYVDTHEVSQEDLDAITLHLDGSGGQPATELQAALKSAARHVGKPSRIELAFAYRGMTHRWMVEAPWLAELDDASTFRRDWRSENGEASIEAPAQDWVDAQEFAAAREAELARLAPQIEGWAVQISEHPEYLVAPRRELRRALVGQILPELDAWIAEWGPGGPMTTARGRAAFDVISRAENLQAQVKARRVAEAKEHADEWAAALVEDADFRGAANAGERKRRAGDFVATRLGFGSPEVRDRLLSLVGRRQRAR